jgi:hypothetical protein
MQQLKFFDLSSLTGSHQDVAAAATILDEITHKDVFASTRRVQC